MARILVLGAGMMGAAITVPAADNAHRVSLVGTPRDSAIIAGLRQSRPHPGLDIRLSDKVEPFLLDDFAAGGVAAGREPPDLIIIAVSSAALSWACDWVGRRFPRPVPVMLVAKGVSTETDAIVPLSDYAVAELARSGEHSAVVSVAGPCIAQDLANRHHTSVVLASRDIMAAEESRALLATDYYHLQTEPDVIGAEICAGFKNLYAIAIGWGAGAGARQSAGTGGVPTVNLKATLFAQALLEIGYLVEVFGGNDKTALGPAGAGDLYVTCEAGRNGRLGRHMGTGLTIHQVLEGPMKGETVEGLELANRVEPHVETLLSDGLIAADRIPLLMAILQEICGAPTETFDFARILGLRA